MKSSTTEVWPTSRLGDLIDAKYGKALPQAKRRGGQVPVYGSNGVVGQHDEAITKGPTIIIGRKGSSGAINLSNTVCWPIDTTYYIDEPGPFSLEFLTILLRSLGLEGLDRSTAIPGLNREQLYDIVVPIPTTGTQGLLVGLIKHIENRADSASSHLMAAKTAIERFRQAVLASACSGRLTADWREAHHENYSQRISDNQSHKVASVELKENVPEGWSVTTLGQLSSLTTSGSRGWAKYYAEAGPLFIRSQNINTDRLILDDLAHVQLPQSAEGLRTRINQGDLLVTITGANVTKAAIVDESISEAYVNQHVALVRLSTPEMVPYVHLWLISPAHGRKQLLEAAYGAGRPGLNLDSLRTLPIAMPPRDEQREIVRRTNELLAASRQVERAIEEAALNVERSSQAVLAKAFRGDLVGCEAEATS